MLLGKLECGGFFFSVSFLFFLLVCSSCVAYGGELVGGVRLVLRGSEEERRWLAEAGERHMMVDVVSRMREIALLMSTPLSGLEAHGITPDDIEGMFRLGCQYRPAVVVDLKD